MRLVLALPVAIVFVIGLMALDVPVAEFFRDTGLAGPIDRATFLRWPGEYRLTVVCALLLWIFHAQSWRSAGFMLLTGLAGFLNGVLKWVSGRSRPFKWGEAWEWDFFRNGYDGLFSPRDLSFASGHTTQAFAWAAGMTIAYPRFRTLFYTLATLTAFQRVGSTDHYLTDAVAAAVIGVVTVRLLFRILSKVVPPAREAPVTDDGQNYEFPRAELFAMNDPAAPYLSLVIPCYNEQENVPTLLSRVESSLNTLGKPFEVILIDDGSTDQTPQMLNEAKSRLPWLRVVRMQKNAGQSAGFEAGFAVARGQMIATIDADLQNDPEEVPRLAKMLDERPDVDMITGWRKDRQDTNFRRWQSRQANRIRNWISQDDINDSACSLKVYRAHTLKGLKLFNGAHRFFPALVKMRGFKVIETPVKHSARFAGTAKYGFRNRAFRAFVDLLGVRWMKMRYLRYDARESDVHEGVSGNSTRRVGQREVD
ncbi:MAG: glycosyltransferase [Burkholderiales bacterium]|nr:glycosyltransferase [Phycisphaerae bacterium]